MELACRYAIQQAKKKGSSEVSADHLLLGCFRTISQFGIVQLGRWNFDLEELGMDWLALAEEKAHKVVYSEDVVDLLNLASRIARANESEAAAVEHVLAAFAGREEGLFGRLTQIHSISSAEWRTAIADFSRQSGQSVQASEKPSAVSSFTREYLTPEEAAEILGIHVQTVRALVRSGKLPGLRLAGERAIRLRRADLEKVFEPAAQMEQR